GVGGIAHCLLGEAKVLRIAIVFVLLLLPAIAHAQKRVALVIGNSAYKHAGKLTNPKNDAADMAAVLRKFRFQVIDGFDLDKVSFDRKVREFGTALANADAGIFFYSGHGLQVAGQNYLVPVDAKAETGDALDFEMVRLDLVQRTMERTTATNVLFLDACRNNPLARNLARAMGTRSTEIGRGLAPVESGVGTLISFSTQPGNVALDGTGRNSPFAGALVRHIANSGDSLSDVLIAVRNDVRKETDNRQGPWEHSSLTGRFYFNTANSPSPSQPGLPNVDESASEWSRLDKTSIAELETFLRQHGSSPEADYARARLADLRNQAMTVAPPPNRASEKGEHAFDGTWDVRGTEGENCRHPSRTWRWNDPMRINGSQIVGRGGSAIGRVSRDGNFQITVRSHGIGTFVGKLQGDNGHGTYRFSDTGCSGAVLLKKF